MPSKFFIVLAFTFFNLIIGFIYNLIVFETASGNFISLNSGSSFGQVITHIACILINGSRVDIHNYCVVVSMNKLITLPLDFLPIFTILVNYIFFRKPISNIIKIRAYNVIALGFLINTLPLILYFGFHTLFGIFK